MTQVTISGERDLLTRHLDWIAAQPWVDEFYDELRRLLNQLRAANGTQEDRPVGRCYLPADNGLCNGPIWLDTVAGHAHCGRCHSTWDGPQLALLSFEMDMAREEAARPHTADGRQMLTAQELAERKKIRVSAVRMRLSRLGAKAQHGSYYDPDVFDVPRHSVEAS